MEIKEKVEHYGLKIFVVLWQKYLVKVWHQATMNLSEADQPGLAAAVATNVSNMTSEGCDETCQERGYTQQLCSACVFSIIPKS